MSINKSVVYDKIKWKNLVSNKKREKYKNSKSKNILKACYKFFICIDLNNKSFKKQKWVFIFCVIIIFNETLKLLNMQKCTYNFQSASMQIEKHLFYILIITHGSNTKHPNIRKEVRIKSSRTTTWCTLGNKIKKKGWSKQIGMLWDELAIEIVNEFNAKRLEFSIIIRQPI
jgi:hypothetical protein